YFPAETPRAQGRRLPVVLDEADVVYQRVEAELAQASEIEIQDVERRRLDDDLELVVVLQPEGVLAVAAVGRTARGLDIGGAPRLGSDGPEEGCRVEGAGPDLHVIGLQNDTATL